MLLTAAVLLAACQPLPRPFGREPGAGPNPLLGLPDARGVTVVGVDGVPDTMARALRTAMAAALLERDLPASATSASRHGHFLSAVAETAPETAGRVDVSLTWEMLDGEGAVKGRHRQRLTLAENDWRQGGPEVANRIARDAAPAIAGMLQDPAPAASGTGRRLFVAPVAGGSEAGNRALGRAMAQALAAAGFEVLAVREADALVVAGTVNIGPPVDGNRTIEVVWSIISGANAVVGSIAQRNAVPAGTVRDGWERLAPAIARNAIGGVRDLLRRLPRGRANRGARNAR